jgi:hypothetical protein
MKTSINLFIAVLLSSGVILFSSCSKDNDITPTGHSGTLQNGLHPASYIDDVDDETVAVEDPEQTDNGWPIGILQLTAEEMPPIEADRGAVLDPGTAGSTDVLSK